MSRSRKSFSRRTFLKAAAGVTAGTRLMGQPLAAQGIDSILLTSPVVRFEATQK